MKRYSVRMPVFGFVEATVEANSKEEALSNFYDIEPDDFETMLDDERINHYEWDYYEKITSGNVLHVPQNSVVVEEED